MSPDSKAVAWDQAALRAPTHYRYFALTPGLRSGHGDPAKLSCNAVVTERVQIAGSRKLLTSQPIPSPHFQSLIRS